LNYFLHILGEPMRKFFLLIAFVVVGSVMAQDLQIFGDPRPDAPELSARGEYGVGVQTMTVTNPDQIDILSFSAENTAPRYDRTLTLEVWYPAVIDGETPVIEYSDNLGRADDPAQTLIPFTFGGRALGDAELDSAGAPYPLIVVSHGFPGSRFMMTYLTENLASKGYIVVAIDHTESVYTDVNRFDSTLLNRPLDIRFTIDEMERMGAADSDSFLAGAVDAQNVGLVGYSMGGYGALNVAGGAYGAAYIPTLTQFGLPTVDLLAVNVAGNEAYVKDDRVKAVYTFAPWGMNFGLWDAESMAGLDVPTFFVAGSQDDVAGYDPGPRTLFDLAVNSERYLLTFEDARHNVAPNPPPAAATLYDQYMRYADNVWDSNRMNNVNQHFATAFFDLYLKGADTAQYLDLVEFGVDGVYSVAEDGSFNDDHTYWTGFQDRSAIGLRFEARAAGE
jgi:predicted dienelactone hydrolase